MAKQITVRCAAEPAALLIDALRWFVASRYPYGADECSSAAREALLDLAGRFERELLAQGQCAYSSRVRAFLCEAVNCYTRQLEEQEGGSWAQRRACLVEIGRGQSEGGDFELAKRQDAVAPQ
jgi:hypothetical protein